MALLKCIAIFLLIVAPLSADQVASTKFKGLNNNSSSVIIDPSEAQALLNVDVSVTGQSIKKRSGYGLYKALGTAKPIHGIYHAFDSSGNDYQLIGSSTSLYGIVANGTPTQLVSSATLNSTWDCADSQGNSYCVDSSRDAYIKTDGTTMSWNASPLGTMVESTPDRIVVAGVSGSPNTLYVSQSNTFTNFTAGVNATDAFTEVIASPGSRLTHIRWGCGKLLWWKDASFGYFDFDDQFTATVKTISDTIGTFDNTSAIDPGGQVWFRGQDGHTWMYDCSILQKESIDITPNVQTSGKRTANLWTQSSASDFNSGRAYATFTDTTSVAGSVTLPNIQTTASNLTAISTMPWGTASQNVSSGTVILSTSGTSTFQYSENWIPLPNDFTHRDVYLEFVGRLPNKFGFTKLMVGVSDSTSSFQTTDGYSFELYNLAPPLQAYSGCLDSPFSSAATGNQSFTVTNPNDTLLHTIGLNVTSNGQGTLFIDGVNEGTAAICWPASGSKFLVITCGSASSQSTPCELSNASISISTGIYSSAVHNAPNLTSWDNLVINSQDNGGTNSFFVRSSSNSFDIASSTPAWVTITPGAVPSISTGTNGAYFQMKDSFTVTAATQVPTLNDFTFNWFEGLATDQAYMLYFDNSIWESVAFGVGQSVNNYIFKYDLINEGWTLYNFGAGGILVQNNTLYFGDTSDGNIFNYGGSTSDNGTAINAYWKTKDFSGADPFLQSQLTNIDTFATKNAGSSLTTTYTMDTSTATSYSISLSNPNQSIIQSRKILPPGKLGQVFNVEYGDTSASSAWELLGFRIGFNQLPYRANTQ